MGDTLGWGVPKNIFEGGGASASKEKEGILEGVSKLQKNYRYDSVCGNINLNQL